jgi:hypothetical protein
MHSRTRSGTRSGSRTLARVLTHRMIHWTRRRLTSGKMKNKMCQKNVTNNNEQQQQQTPLYIVIPAWTQLIVTLCDNNLVSNKQSIKRQKFVSVRNKRTTYAHFKVLLFTPRRDFEISWRGCESVKFQHHP